MMLLTMDLEIQQNLAHLGANDMLKELKALYSKQAEQELLQTVREFHTCRQEECQSVSSYVLKMKSYIDQLESLGHPVTLNLRVSLILVGLSKEYDSFVQNYKKHNMGKTVNELHAILKLHEETLPKKVVALALHAIKAGKAYANAEPSYAPKPKIPPPPKKDNPAKDAICHHCGIFTIELYSFPSTSWVYDTGCGTHICNTSKGLRGSKKLNPGALSLYVGNGQREAVEAIGNYHLCLPSGLVIVLNNCHYAPSITIGIVLVSRLYEDGFINRFELNNAIFVSKNNVVYFTAISRDGLYEIEMSCSNTNDSSMYTVINKRAKLNLDSYLLWHCRLGHISKKRIEKLQHDGGTFLNSIDTSKSLGNVCFMQSLERWQRKPYSASSGKGPKDQLRTIHPDVYAHLEIMSRQGSNNTTKSFWDYALESAARILNMVPTKKVDKTPYEIWHGQAPKLSYLKVWGCEALVKRDTLTKPDKLEPRSFKCIFIGYPKETMGYSFYNPSENKIFVARNAEFFESNLLDQEASGSLEDLEIIQEEDTNPSLDTSLNHEEDDQEIDEPQSDINPIRRSTRTKRAPDRMCLYIDAEEHELGDLGEPANYKAALLDPESEKWLAAMNVEMQSMKDNDVWELVELPPNAKTVGHKWLFKKKTDMDGAVHTFKSRLVAKGFTQTYGVDYEETFSPVADIRAIRILIAIVAFYDYEIWQMDVKTAFLNGHLSEEVYMTQPEGFVNPKYPNHVCKLKRSIYGLKQASRQWNKRFDDEIKKFGFTQNRDEPYVKSYLRRCVAMKDLGEAAYILGIKIYRDRSKRLIEKLKLSKSDGSSTPSKEAAHENPGELHWTTVMNILKYLRNTKDIREMFSFLNGGVVDWKSTKQSIFATSSTDAEYIAAFDTSKEAAWIHKFISGLNVVPTIEEPITMYCDNTRAIAIANDHGVTKGDVRIEKVDTDDNLADPFTKALAFPKHSELTRKIALIPGIGYQQKDKKKGQNQTKLSTGLERAWKTKAKVLLAEKSILTVMQTLEEKKNDTESMQELLLQLSKDLQTLGNTSNQLKAEEQIVSNIGKPPRLLF
ncbi:retrotransposon protein, putative, ty1-copia subclass [Tanacetum coccineum]